MATDQSTSLTANRRIALLIDADNVTHAKIGAILTELSRYGTTNIRRAYGDWGSAALKGWKSKLHEFAIRPIQQFSYSTGKNATDMALVIDAMELLYTQKLDAFCIASSDADFTPLVMQLKANGHDVYGFGERKTPDPFVNACTTFLYLEALDDPEPVPPLTEKSDAPEAKAAPKARAASRARPAVNAIVETGITPGRELRRDAKLVGILRGGVEATVRDDGWAQLGAAGSAVKRQAPIDPRNYGYKDFRKLFEATELFEIARADDNGQFYVADKRNKERTATPRGGKG